MHRNRKGVISLTDHQAITILRSNHLWNFKYHTDWPGLPGIRLLLLLRVNDAGALTCFILFSQELCCRHNQGCLHCGWTTQSITRPVLVRSFVVRRDQNCDAFFFKKFSVPKKGNFEIPTYETIETNGWAHCTRIVHCQCKHQLSIEGLWWITR